LQKQRDFVRQYVPPVPQQFANIPQAVGVGVVPPQKIQQSIVISPVVSSSRPPAPVAPERLRPAQQQQLVTFAGVVQRHVSAPVAKSAAPPVNARHVLRVVRSGSKNHDNATDSRDRSAVGNATKRHIITRLTKRVAQHHTSNGTTIVFKVVDNTTSSSSEAASKRLVIRQRVHQSAKHSEEALQHLSMSSGSSQTEHNATVIWLAAILDGVAAVFAGIGHFLSNNIHLEWIKFLLPLTCMAYLFYAREQWFLITNADLKRESRESGEEEKDYCSQSYDNTQHVANNYRFHPGLLYPVGVGLALKPRGELFTNNPPQRPLAPRHTGVSTYSHRPFGGVPMIPSSPDLSTSGED